jgi:hypothetical protein
MYVKKEFPNQLLQRIVLVNDPETIVIHLIAREYKTLLHVRSGVDAQPHSGLSCIRTSTQGYKLHESSRISSQIWEDDITWAYEKFHKY